MAATGVAKGAQDALAGEGKRPQGPAREDQQGPKRVPSEGANEYVVLCNGVEKSPLDERDFLPFQLPNGMRVMCVSDPQCDKAGAGLSVGVGHFSDEREVPGLAHFLEHMVFMGTEKYPDENEFSAFLSRCGGAYNAVTEQELTGFFFDVNHTNLLDVLDRFAQFFIKPLLYENSQEREVRAVDSEHAKNLLSDAWRFMQLERTTSSSEHSYSKFGTGDRITLETTPKANGIDVRKKLLDFHAKYYQANRMGLVILGREPVNVLREWAERLFTQVPNDGPSTIVSELPPNPSYALGSVFPGNVLDRIMFVEPIKDRYTVEVTWEIPSMFRHYLAEPEAYAVHLLGHESHWSILANLKARELAVNLSAGTSFDCNDFTLLKVTVECTSKGAREGFREVLATIFEYAELMRVNGVQERIFKEFQLLEQLRFRFQSKPDSFRFCRNISANLLRYPAEHALSAGALVKVFDPVRIQQVLDLLTPQRARAFVSFQGCKEAFPHLTWQKEKWYQTDYATGQETLSQICNSRAGKNSGPALALPLPNEFIPEDFSLRVPKAPTPAEQRQFQLQPPSRASATPRTLQVWYKQDHTYGMPRAVFKALLVAPGCYATPRASTLAELAGMVAMDALNELAYDADVAGLQWNWNNSTRGMILTVMGYNDKLGVFLKRLVASITDPETYGSEKVLARQLERYTRSLENFRKENAYQIAMYEASAALNVPRWNLVEKAATLKKTPVTCAELQAFVKANILGEGASLITLCVGNITRVEALAWGDLVWTKFGLNAGYSPAPSRVVAVPSGSTTYLLRHRSEHSLNSALEFICQLGADDGTGDSNLAAVASVLANLSEEPCFNQLRTIQQLGYIVSLGLRRDGPAVYSIRIVVQSSAFPSETLIERCFGFLFDLESILLGYSDEDFKEHIRGCVQNHLEADLSLGAEARRWWNELDAGSYAFDRDEKLAKRISAVTRSEVIDLYRSQLHPRSAARRFFISVVDAKPGTPAASNGDVVIGNQSSTDATALVSHDKFGGPIKVVENLSAWREACSLWPYVERPANL